MAFFQCCSLWALIPIFVRPQVQGKLREGDTERHLPSLHFAVATQNRGLKRPTRSGARARIPSQRARMRWQRTSSWSNAWAGQPAEPAGGEEDNECQKILEQTLNRDPICGSR